MNEAILELGRKGVSDAAPTGAPCRDDLAFEALQNEFQKLERPDAPAPDWIAAEKSARELLSGKSKDLLVAAYFAVAVFERSGYGDFADAMTMMREMCAGWWDTLFPERPRGRQAALQFLGDRGARRVAGKGDSGASREDVERAMAAMDELDTIASEKLEGVSGLFSELRRELHTVLDGMAPAAPEPAAAPATPEPTASAPVAAAAAPAAPALPTSIGSADDWDAAANAVKPALRALAEFRRTADLKDPLPYRLVRLAAWLTIKQSPPSNGGATSIPVPQPPDFATRVEAKLASQAWAGVLEDTEGRAHMAVFWLDLHFWAWSALKGLGAGAAADAVAAELKTLLVRCPDLPTLTFATGQPLAGDATKAWIKDVVLAAAPAGGGAAVKSSGAPTEVTPDAATFEGLAEAKAQAAELAGGGDVAGAVRLLEAGAARATRARERAAWKIAVAEACADAGRPDVALAQLEALQEELQATRLEMWDPDLSAQLLRLLLWARQKALPPTQMNAEEHQRSRELLKKLARLDAAAALDYARPAQG